MPVQGVDDQAVVVHRERHQFQARLLRGLPQPRGPGILHADRGMPVGQQRPAEPGHALPGPHDDADRARFGRGAPAPVQVLGQDGAQLRQAARLGVGQPVERRGLGRGPDRPHPLTAGEGPQVRVIRRQVEAGRRGRPGGPRRAPAGRIGPGLVTGPGRPGHPGRRTGLPGQVALGDELAVGLGDRPARDAQVGGEHPAGRQRRAHRQPPVPDRRPDGRGQPHVQRPGPGGGQVKERLPGQIGLSSCHAIGS